MAEEKTLLNDIKLSLRLSGTHFNDEVNDLIEAARLDLIQSGVSPELAEEKVDIDPLIKRAITIYCKAYFGYDNPDADRLANSYLMLKQHLALAGDYNALG